MPEKTPDPDEYGRYRVRDLDTGHERTINAVELPHGNYEVLKDPASDPATGVPVPEKLAAGKPITKEGDIAVPTAYDSDSVKQLKAEVEKRNDARGDDEPPIEVAEPGNKPQLIAALVADDAAQAAADGADA